MISKEIALEVLVAFVILILIFVVIAIFKGGKR